MVSVLISWSTDWSVKIDQSINQPVSPLVSQSICLCSAIHLTFCLFVSLSVYLSVHLSFCLSVCLSVSQSINQMAYNSNVSNLNNESCLYNTKVTDMTLYLYEDIFLGVKPSVLNVKLRLKRNNLKGLRIHVSISQSADYSHITVLTYQLLIKWYNSFIITYRSDKSSSVIDGW